MSNTADETAAVKTELQAALEVDLSDEEGGPLDEFVESIQAQCERLENQGESVTQLIVELAVAHEIDTEIADQLQDSMIELLGNTLDEHDEATVKEVAIALWFELVRIEEMLSSDTEEANDEPPSEASEPTSGMEPEANNKEDEAVENLEIHEAEEEDGDDDKEDPGLNGMFQ